MVTFKKLEIKLKLNKLKFLVFMMCAFLQEFSANTKFISFNQWSCQKLHG